jgi:hypothetical protein
MSFATHIHVTRIARMEDNEMRHVIHVAVNVAGVTSRYVAAYKIIRNIPQGKDIYMSILGILFSMDVGYKIFAM